MNKEAWNPGETAFFEYHCYQGHDSADAELWYRSHSRVTIVREEPSDALKIMEVEPFPYDERMDTGHPRLYRVRFLDGYEDSATEDELYTSPEFFVPEAAPPHSFNKSAL